jgi:hypothetical protein
MAGGAMLLGNSILAAAFFVLSLALARMPAMDRTVEAAALDS